MVNEPRKTLHDRISGRVQSGIKPGPNPCLQGKVEKAPIEHLISATQQVNGKIRKQIKMKLQNQRVFFGRIKFQMNGRDLLSSNCYAVQHMSE